MNSDSENDPIIKLLNLLNFVRVLDNHFASMSRQTIYLKAVVQSQRENEQFNVLLEKTTVRHLSR